MAGYNRTDTTNNIATGNIINAADFDAEYDAIDAAFDEATGHVHDGTSGNGAPITKVGPVQDLVISNTAVIPKVNNTLDLGTSALQFKDAYIDGTAYIDALDLNGTLITPTATELNYVDGVTSAIQTQLDNKQPLDADLTAIAGLTSAANKLPYFTGSGTAAVTDFSAFGRTLVDDADAATARTTLGVVIGTNVQAYDAELAALASVTSAADKVPYFTGSGTAAVADLTSFGRSLIDDADAATARTTLGLVIGTNVQAYDAQLADVAGLTPTDNNFIVGNGTNFVAESGATARTSLGLGSIATQDSNNVNITGGSVSGITDLAIADGGTGASTAADARTNLGVTATGADTTYAFRANNLSDLASASTARTNLGLGTAATTAASDYLTATNPSYTGTLTGGTGVVNLGSGQFYKDASGNVGIGTTSAGQRLTVATATAYQLRLGDSNAVGVYDIGRSNVTGFFNLYGNQTGFTGYVFGGVDGERMRIDSSGNVGIGTTTMTGKLNIAGNVLPSADSSYSLGASGSRWLTVNAVTFSEGGAANNFITTSSTTTLFNSGSTWQQAAFYSAGAERMRIDSSGNVGIGTSSPTTRLGFGSYIPANGQTINVFESGNAKSGLGVVSAVYRIYTDSTSSMSFGQVSVSDGSTYSERMRIDSSGNLLIGKTTNAANVVGTAINNGSSINTARAASTNASSTFEVYSTDAGAYRFYVGMGGTIFATSTSISAISDQRLKENVRPLDLGLSEVMALQPRKFDWIEGKGQNKKDAVGFIAQEFETVLPNSVGTSKAGEDGIEYKNINYEELVPTLVKAIQEQQALITNLTTRLNALEGK